MTEVLDDAAVKSGEDLLIALTQQAYVLLVGEMPADKVIEMLRITVPGLDESIAQSIVTETQKLIDKKVASGELGRPMKERQHNKNHIFLFFAVVISMFLAILIFKPTS